MEPIDPRSGLHILSRAECVALLGRNQHRVGRMALVHLSRPRILPVNHVISDDRVLFRTDEGIKLDAALHQAHVEFEIDEVDHAARLGWSVVVAGVAGVVDDMAMLLRSYGLEPHAPGPKQHWVAVEPAIINGREFDDLGNGVGTSTDSTS